MGKSLVFVGTMSGRVGLTTRESKRVWRLVDLDISRVYSTKSGSRGLKPSVCLGLTKTGGT
jgi:hypothetical protein